MRLEKKRMAKEDDRDQKQDPENDTEGHSLLLDTDYYLQRKVGRDSDLEREARERRQAKEARTNKPERR
jgi:hypothetical protein